MDSGQFAVSTGMSCQRTPEPTRVVVRLHRTTDPPRAHLSVTFLCEQKGDSPGGSREKRSTNPATTAINLKDTPRRRAIAISGSNGVAV